MRNTAVVVAGGGPIGLTLGHELAPHGIACIVVERNTSTTIYPKMDLTNSRSMELYHRLGLSDLIRSVGVPPANNFDVMWMTSLAGHQLHRFTYPSQSEMWERIQNCNDGSMPAEPAVRISQILLEPALKAALELRQGAHVQFGWMLDGFEQDEDGVTCTVRDAATGATDTIRCCYLVGCDGGGSRVRAALGIELDGDYAVRSSYMIHFRSRAHEVLQRWGITWHAQQGNGTLIAQDDDQYWTLQMRIPPDADPNTADPRDLLRRFLGTHIDAEILIANPWEAHLVVARKYGSGHVFLAGDAAHQVVPTGGYGMNTGVGDAVDLGWKIAAVLRGWRGPALLASYEAERRPVALRNREASHANLEIRFEIARLYAAAHDLEAATSGGAEARARLAAQIRAIGNAENERWGIEYGYIYADSPVICDERENPPAFDELRYQPTTWPGARLPSIILDNGIPLYERIGPGFTLIAFDGEEVGDIEAVAQGLGIPLRVLQLRHRAWRPVYERRLILVRADHHVAWRGDRIPPTWSTVLAHVAGHRRRT
jgi:2-polyprenyl-6-methoxyphenol hydroxylase-like FAD-dependent oxidoreductase